MTDGLKDKRVLLIIGGGIAAYKCLDLIRRLRERGVRVRVIVTRAGCEFVTPLSVSTLAGERVHTDLFDLTDEIEIGHIALARDTDLVVVAPATAALLAKMANGLADDLASTALLATDKPVLAAPAMNTRMWNKPATKRNLATLRGDAVQMVGPNDGPLAEGESGPGRMAEPAEIIAAIETLLGGAVQAPVRAGRLKGRKVLVTSGPTWEAIDPVRYIANRSSGKQGHAIAAALAGEGAEVVLVSGPVQVADPAGVTVVHVESAREMLAACEAALPVDAAVCAAAVADWRAATTAQHKIKKDSRKTEASLALMENPDILASLGQRRKGRPRLVVGFAAETEHLIEHARAKLSKKRCDWIVANDVSPHSGVDGGVMGGDENIVHLVDARSEETWPKMSKEAVAVRLTQRIADHLKAKAKS